MFEFINHELHCEDLSVHALAEKYGTPLYIYSKAHIEQQYTKLYNALSEELGTEPLISYACKANDRLAVLKIIGDLGGGVDIVSGGELRKVLAAGIAPEKIIFSGVGKRNEELELAITSGIRQINIETEPGLDHIREVMNSFNKKHPINVVFRLNPDVEAGTHDKISTGRSEDKFGLSADRIKLLYKKASEIEGVTPVGISIHIGSQVADPRYFVPAFRKIRLLVEELRQEGHSVTELDLGGGLGITYRDEPEADLNAYAHIIKQELGKLDCHFSFEPGRFIVGNAGILVSRVVCVKETDVKTHLIIDAAMNDLIRPSLYDAWHTITPVIQNRDRAQHVYDIVGPVCESGDTFAKERYLNEVKEGELVAIKSTGAYGAVMSSYYNARSPASEVMVDGRKDKLLFKSRSIDDIIQEELKNMAQ